MKHDLFNINAINLMALFNKTAEGGAEGKEIRSRIVKKILDVFGSDFKIDRGILELTDIDEQDTRNALLSIIKDTKTIGQDFEAAKQTAKKLRMWNNISKRIDLSAYKAGDVIDFDDDPPVVDAEPTGAVSDGTAA